MCNKLIIWKENLLVGATATKGLLVAFVETNNSDYTNLLLLIILQVFSPMLLR